MPSDAFADLAPILAREGLAALLASDLELAGLCDAPVEAHVARERARVEEIVRSGGSAFSSDRALVLFRALAWDTKHFGVGVADVARIYGDEPALDHLLDHAARAGVTLLSARCRADRPDHTQALEARGFRWVDTSIEIGKPLGGDPPRITPDPRVRAARADDVPALRAIAREFRRNRFHFDPRIPKDKAAGVYESWVTNAAEGRGESLLVAQDGARVAGFCGYRAPAAGDALRAATLTLFVIAREARGRGLFDALHAAVERVALANGALALVSSTQVHNARALHAFARAGMRPFSARHVFHRWAG